MNIELGIGKETQFLTVPDSNLLKVLLPNDPDMKVDESMAIQRALAAPTGTAGLSSMVKPGQAIVIITSDVTRPMPTARVLPFVVEELEKGGAHKEDITVVIAIGSHRATTEDEKKRILGELYGNLRCLDSDPADCIRMGVTSAGTPVDITRVVAEADLRICLGNVEYHYFAGYSGGAKAIMPGVSTREAIQCNHKMMTDPRSCVGNLSDNPLRKDLEEALLYCPAHFILNVVLDEHKRILKAAAGDAILAHREACAFLDTIYEAPLEKRADIVITSQGGAPKDLNLYQTQKALDNARHAVKDGGTIILMGACREGLGESHFEEWLLGADKSRDLIDRLNREFILGGHKAAAIAMVLERADIYLVSNMPEALVRDIFLEPFADVQTAFETALKKHGRDATVVIMPYGGSTLPRVSATSI